jgi:hypothetical protein
MFRKKKSFKFFLMFYFIAFAFKVGKKPEFMFQTQTFSLISKL